MRIRGRMCFSLRTQGNELGLNPREKTPLSLPRVLRGVGKLSHGPDSVTAGGIRSIGLTNLQDTSPSLLTVPCPLAASFLCRTCGQMRALSVGCLGRCSFWYSTLPSSLLRAHVFPSSLQTHRGCSLRAHMPWAELCCLHCPLQLTSGSWKPES